MRRGTPVPVGGRREARAWRDALDGMIRPSWIDIRGMRHWLIIGRDVVVDVLGPAE